VLIRTSVTPFTAGYPKKRFRSIEVMQEERGSFGLERLRDQFDQPRPWMAGLTRDRLRCSRFVGKGVQQLFSVTTACRRNLSVVDALRCAGEVQRGMMESQGSQPILRWREKDSNPRSPVGDSVFETVPELGDDQTGSVVRTGF
jgi:hypothetical protein